MIRCRHVLIVAFMISCVVLFAQDSNAILESFLVDSWDRAGSAYYTDSQGNETQQAVIWQVQGSKYTAEKRPEMVYVPGEWPVSLFGTRPEDPESLGIMGLRGAFNRQGYNEIEIVTGIREGDDFEPRPIPIPGRVHKFDLWVWGSNQNLYIEFHFEDYMGMSHVFSPVRADEKRNEGSLRYVGWQNLYIETPNYIRRAVNIKESVPNLVLKKIVLVTHPTANVRDFFVYFDHLRVLTDRKRSYYDGYDLASKKRIDEIWNTGE